MTCNAFVSPLLPFHPVHVSHCPNLTATSFTGKRLPQYRPAAVARVNPPLLPSLRPRELPRCYADASHSHGDDDDDDDDYDGKDEDEDEEADLELWEDSSQRSLPVGVQYTIPHKGINYIACYPIDDPVAFARVGATGELEVVLDHLLIEPLFAKAEAVLSDEHITLHNTPFVLTATDFGESDLAEDDEDGDDDEDEDEDADDAAEVIAEFDDEGQSYYVVRPTSAVLLIAKEVNDGERYEIVDEDELKRISPVIEEFIEGLATQPSYP